MTNSHDDEHTHSLSTVWSYSTSTDQGNAGQESDVFLVPSLAIILRLTQTVRFNASDCTVDVPVSYKFDVGDPENRKALNFVSYGQLKTTILPKLKAQLENLQNNSTSKPEDIKLTNATINAWNEALEEYNQVNSNAASGTLESATKWFSSKSNMRPTCEYAVVEYSYQETTKTDSLSNINNRDRGSIEQAVKSDQNIKTTSIFRSTSLVYKCTSPNKSLAFEAEKFLHEVCSFENKEFNLHQYLGNFDDIRFATYFDRNPTKCSLPTNSQILTKEEDKVWKKIPSDHP